MKHYDVILQLSRPAYVELRDALCAAGYGDQVHADVSHGEVIDLRGIAVAPLPDPCPVCSARMVICHICAHQWCLDHSPNPLVCPQCGARP